MPDTPLINGHKYGWASIELGLVDGSAAREFSEITYDTDGKPGDVRGAGMRVLGTTRGEAGHEGSITLTKAESQRIINKLGGPQKKGFMLKKFPITVSYSEDGEGGVITDTLLGCRITKVGNAPKQGPEGVRVKFDLHIMRIKYDGVDPFEDR